MDKFGTRHDGAGEAGDPVTDDGKSAEEQGPAGRQPVFLLPGAVTALCLLLLAIHLGAGLLGQRGLNELTFWLGFVPLRFVYGAADPAAWVPLIWTPFTHALLHANWEHVLINTAWLAIFATPVARRYGAAPMVVLFFVSAAAGAAAFTATSLYDGRFLVGASGGVAGLTGAAVRFIFQPPVIMQDPVSGRPVVVGRRLASLGELFRNPRSRLFTIVWLALNAAVPLLPLVMGGERLPIAWEAHIGGFVAGLLLVPLFERRG